MSPWFPEATQDRELLAPMIEETVGRLLRARDSERMPHAVMFVGPPGLGRELAAADAAALLTCPDRGGPGCSCGSCRRARGGTHPDVRVIVGEGKSGRIFISQIREVVRDVPSRPFEGAARVWILDGVEAARFGAEAANAFLKTLEEPPDHARFVLLAANPDAVLATIRSRCQSLILPGRASMATVLTDVEDVPPSLTAPGDVGRLNAERHREISSALAAAPDGDRLPLFRAAREVGATPDGLEIAAAAAGDLAATDSGERGERLSLLADALLRAARTTRAFNLTPERQLLAALLRWSSDEETAS